MPEEIDAMPAGRAMDALVAERCLGWFWVKDRTFNVRFLAPPSAKGDWHLPLADGSEHLAASWQASLVGQAWTGFPACSTDIAAAWSLVEKYAMRITAPLPCCPEAPWVVSDWVHKTGRLDKAVATTAPLAICRAALKAALGGEA